MTGTKIRWGILETAKLAKEHIIPAILQSENGEVCAVVSRSLAKAKVFANETGVPKFYGSYGDPINDVEIDAVYIPLPPAMHKEWSLKCLEKGKPVLCEKPLAANARDVRVILSAFKRAKVLFSKAYMYLFNPCIPKFGVFSERGKSVR